MYTCIGEWISIIGVDETRDFGREKSKLECLHIKIPHISFNFFAAASFI